MILTLVTFIPAVGAVLIALLPRGRAAALKRVGLAVSVVTFLVSLPLWTLSLRFAGRPNSFTANAITQRSSLNSFSNCVRSPT